MLQVSPETEENLMALAQSRGLSVDAYLQAILGNEIQATSQSGDEKARAFIAWADSFPETSPLSDEAISRASMYPDRW